MSLPLPPPSGSTKIYATAKKEWVIPPRPKPGRKPKAVAQDELDFDEDGVTEKGEKGKKSLNRAAQRAFRERKQTQLMELQARIQQYEQGEIDRSVALQNLGKHLKQENDALRQEVSSLKEENAALRARLSAVENVGDDATGREGIKVGADKTITSNKRERNHSLSPPRERFKRLRLIEFPQVNRGTSSLTPSASSANSGRDSASPISIDMEEISDEFTPLDMAEEEGTFDNRLVQPTQSSGCGLCTSSVDCLCRQLGIRHAEIDSVSQQVGLADSLLVDDHKVISISSVAPLDTGSSTSRCSGDPSKCTACANNSFGRAFCSSLAKSAGGQSTSSGRAHAANPDIPKSVNPKLTQCCRDPFNCTRGGCSSVKDYQKLHAQESSIRTLTGEVKDARDNIKESPVMDVDTVPCDIAWKAIEAHPNAHLADPRLGPSQLANLNLLADVVAGRSRCTLAPGESLPEPEDFPKRNDARQSSGTLEISSNVRSSEMMSRASARVEVGYEESVTTGTERTLVPRELLEKDSNHPRITAVRAEGLRDAIALLNREFGCSS